MKPEICRSEDVAGLSIAAQLAFERLLLFADDEGRMKYNPKIIKSDVFPLLDEITADDCADLVSEMIEVGLVSIYAVDGANYLHIAKFQKHQVINKPQKSKFPSPPGETEHSRNATVAMQEQQESDTGELPVGKEQGTGNREQGNKNIVGQTRPIIDYLNEKTGKAFQHTSQKTRSLISARLSEGRSLEDFKTVIDLKSTQWLGKPEMAKYLRPETLFSAAHFESYLNEQGGVKDAEIEQYANAI